MSWQSLGEKVKDILAMTKPAQLALLAFTAFAAYFASGGPLSAYRLVLLALDSFLSIGGITALNMTLEHDLDSIMDRTKVRPIPSGRLSYRQGLAASLAMTLAGFVTATLLNVYVLLTNVLALVFDIPLYTMLLKRRSPINIIVGGIAGVMPALGGWAAGAGGIGLGALLLAVEVLAWIPVHIWYIVYYYENDYRKANVPMLPIVGSHKEVAGLSSLSIAVLVAAAWAYWLVTGKGLIGAALSVPLAGMAIKYIWDFYAQRSAGVNNRKLARKIFMMANPILVVLFLLSPFTVPGVALAKVQLGTSLAISLVR